jgi:hypothetical protein
MEPSLETSPAKKEPDKSYKGTKVKGHLSADWLPNYAVLPERAASLRLMFVACTWEVPVSILGRGAAYTERFLWLPSLPSEECRNITSIRPRLFPSVFFPIRHP